MNAKEMSLSKDYHTHTIYSHGKGTIEDNVRAALARNLDEIAISDHGPGHVTYGVKRNKFSEMRTIIDEMNIKLGKRMVKLGVEANIIDLDGRIDVGKELLEKMDIVLAGYHFGAFSKHYMRESLIHGRNLMGNFFSTQSHKLRRINTELVIKAIYTNDIDILTHPGAKAEVDIRAIAKACAERDTLLEINNSHGHLSVDEIKIAMNEDVRFIIGSDAHRPCDVGRCELSVERIIKAGLELERVVNLREGNRLG